MNARCNLLIYRYFTNEVTDPSGKLPFGTGRMPWTCVESDLTSQSAVKTDFVISSKNTVGERIPGQMPHELILFYFLQSIWKQKTTAENFRPICGRGPGGM
jgi:hypothetical protein